MTEALSLAAEDRASLEARMQAWGQPRSHALRVLRHYYDHHGRPDWEALTSIGRALRTRLTRHTTGPAVRVVRRVVATDGTRKLLLALRGGGRVEAVLMPSYRAGEAWCCVSSQVGCAMGCDFCASTRAGLERNLGVDEIVGQFLALRAEAAAIDRRVRRLVFMGMGEPMHNLDAVTGAIERIAEPGLGALGYRRITVSTVGIVRGIERLAGHDPAVHLAVSLHAPDDETRARIVPTTRRYKVADILDAARHYQARTKRIVNIEYCLLAGVNDHDHQADLLAERLAGFRAHVNLIPYNPIGGPGLSGVAYQRPSPARVDHFLERLRERGVVAHARDARGDDVAAACGQLREQATS